MFLTPVPQPQAVAVAAAADEACALIVSDGFHMCDWQLDAKIATENAEGSFWNPAPTWFASTPPVGMLGLAMFLVLLTVGGWNEAAYLSSEVHTPSPKC